MITATELTDEIKREYLNGAKKDVKIGVELERIPIQKESFSSIPYSGDAGMNGILKEFSRYEGWDYITDAGTIIGLKNDNDTITLEPGCQFELSIEPKTSIIELKSKIDSIDKSLKPILKKYDVKFLNYGINPVTTYRHISLLPKQRYHLMANYLWGILSDVMMRETAGIQICIDFKNEEDAMRKFRLSNMIMPFVTAICANSPIRGGVDTGYKSFRGLSWLNTDNERCPFMSKKLYEGKYSFSQYISDVLETPMIFINRDKPVFINGKINFAQFLKNGYNGLYPTIEDFKLHANLYFPDVRLRNFIEIRNHDCSAKGMPYALMALYKGIMYDDNAMWEVENILSKFSYYQLAELRYSVVKTALETKIGRVYINEYAREIVKIAYNSLKENFSGEEHFLEPIIEIVSKCMTPADIILRNWEGSWNKNVSKLVDYVTEDV